MDKNKVNSDELYKEFKPLILYYAKLTHSKIGSLVEYEDIFQTLCVAFFECINKFKDSDGIIPIIKVVMYRKYKRIVRDTLAEFYLADNRMTFQEPVNTYSRFVQFIEGSYSKGSMTEDNLLLLSSLKSKLTSKEFEYIQYVLESSLPINRDIKQALGINSQHKNYIFKSKIKEKVKNILPF